MFKQQSGEPKTLVNQLKGLAPRIFLFRLYTVLTDRDDELRREEEPVLPLIPQLHGCKRGVITFNVPVVYMAQDVMILMRENPISRAFGRVGPQKVEIFRHWHSKATL